ncbi:MAG: chalcone isomerase family protein [Deltaproteobacteria bacterium]|nr:chalcone isomerase family protein [Deltaproteobacteria bacterium]
MCKRPGKLQAFFLILGVIFLFAGNAGALTIKGVEFADNTEISGKTLHLNGAGIRKKFFLPIYACGLYLPHPTSDAEKAIRTDVAKQVVMHFIHSKVGKEKIVQGWNDGFFNNSQEKLSVLQERINTFNAFFDRDLVVGDRIVITYLPEQGTSVSINQTDKGSIPGIDFMQALWAIWLGSNPADAGMKDGMLGK